MPLRGLVSIHDVMPETREAVTALLAGLSAWPARSVTLLVVPGRAWPADDVAWLQGLQRRGHPLAGHGWYHRCGPPRTLGHRLHSALLSRHVAEHLSLDSEGVAGLIRDCHAWFGERGLTPAPLYVPPAWALGPLSVHRLKTLPFRYYETLAGWRDGHTGDFTALPLVGFEADSAGRALGLRLLNGVSLAAARLSRRPLRIAIHPHDASLRLAAELPVWLRRLDRALDGFQWLR